MDMPEIGALHEDEHRALKLLMQCVLSYEGDYCVHSRVDSPTRVSMSLKPSTTVPKRTYTVTFLDGTEPAISEPIVCRSDLDRRLQHQGYTIGCDHSTQGFKFSNSGLDRLREVFPPSNGDVMRYIGHALYLAWQEHPKLLYSGFHLDVEPFCARRGITPKRFGTQANLMVSLGLAKFSGHVENQVHEGYLWLTQEGLQWASRGFPDFAGADMAPTVNIDLDVQVQLHVTIQATIQQVQQSLDIPEDLRQRFIEALEAFDNEPTYERVRDILAFGVDTATAGQYTLMFIPFLINLFAAGGDIFNKLFAFPHLVS
jgi:hypothetical protein